MGLVVAALLFFALMFLITRFQPRPAEISAIEQAGEDTMAAASGSANVDSLHQQVDALLGNYHQRISAGMDEVEGIELLDQAIALQNEIIGSRTSEIAARADVDRLRELQTIKHETMGVYLAAQSMQQEEQAKQAYVDGDFEEAVRLLNRAINLQKEINAQYPLASSSNASRVHQLSGQVLEWQTQPIAARADKLRNDAFELASHGNYAEARQVIRAALNEQKILNTQYRQSRHATLRRLKTFEDAVVEIDTAEDTSRVAVLLEEIRLALDSAEPGVAEARAEEALILQQGIVESFQSTSGAQTDLLEEIRMLKDTAASMPAFDRIQSLRAQTRSALQDQDVQRFQEQVAEWSRETTVFQRRYKLSRLLADLDLEEVEYLHAMRAEIPAILEMVYGNLLPVPGIPDLRLYRTEVPQALYESVTGMNPSSIKDPLNPVDSVTWEEAVAFTGMLATALARPVALPGRTVYDAVLGEPGMQQIQSLAWAAENSNRQVQRCGTRSANNSGFHDLLGNVAEWVGTGSPGTPDSVTAIGGSARDSSALLVSIPEDRRPPGERNRYIGFRFVVANPPDTQ